MIWNAFSILIIISIFPLKFIREMFGVNPIYRIFWSSKKFYNFSKSYLKLTGLQKVVCKREEHWPTSCENKNPENY